MTGGNNYNIETYKFTIIRRRQGTCHILHISTTRGPRLNLMTFGLPPNTSRQQHTPRGSALGFHIDLVPAHHDTTDVTSLATAVQNRGMSRR